MLQTSVLSCRHTMPILGKPWQERIPCLAPSKISMYAVAAPLFQDWMMYNNLPRYQSGKIHCPMVELLHFAWNRQLHMNHPSIERTSVLQLYNSYSCHTSCDSAGRYTQPMLLRIGRVRFSLMKLVNSVSILAARSDTSIPKQSCPAPPANLSVHQLSLANKE